MTYREIILELGDFENFSDIFIAQLSELGFDSFQEDPPFLKAYIESDQYTPEIFGRIEDLISHYKLITDREMEKINWNEEWEKNYQALSIDDFCYIRAPFHPSKEGFEYELLIEPKMSFGTGHHATTQNMIRLLSVHKGFKSVADIGSGTGILAILSAKMGAEEVFATDIEDWAFENMKENFERNQIENYHCFLGSLPIKEISDRRFDLVFANINKNVLLEQLPMYRDLMEEHASLFLSGFYLDDEADIIEAATACGLKKIKGVDQDQWMAIELKLTTDS